MRGKTMNNPRSKGEMVKHGRDLTQGPNELCRCADEVRCDMRAEIKRLTAELFTMRNIFHEQDTRIAELEGALDKLARLGNGPDYGNSDGNVIAQQALAKGEQANEQ